LSLPGILADGKTHCTRAHSFTFFSVKIPLKAAYFEEKIYREVEEVEEGRENEALYRNLFDAAVKKSSKTWNRDTVR
jgi:hypothetical protein